MNGERVWSNRRIIRLFWAGSILYLAALAFALFARRRTGESLLFQLAGLIFFISLAVSNRITIVLDKEGFRYRRGFARKEMKWDDIKEYSRKGEGLAIEPNRPGIAPVFLDLRFVENQQGLLESIDAGIGHPGCTCLRCGTRIGGKEESCPACHWSWQEAEN